MKQIIFISIVISIISSFAGCTKGNTATAEPKQKDKIFQVQVEGVDNDGSKTSSEVRVIVLKSDF